MGCCDQLFFTSIIISYYVYLMFIFYLSEFTLGRVHLKTIKGDVTEQPVEAIVRVTKKDLGFEAGTEIHSET